MVEVVLRARGMAVTWRLPDHISAQDFISHAETKLGAKGEILSPQKQTNAVAPLENQSGAQVAQNAAPDDMVPPKGGRASGASAPLLPLTRRSPARLPPSGEGTKARRTDRERVEYYRSEIRLLAAEKAKLAPAFDSHSAMIKSAKADLAASFKRNPCPVVMTPDVRTHRKALYAKLVEAGDRWGKPAKQFREITAMISVLTSEAERLERVP